MEAASRTTIGAQSFAALDAGPHLLVMGALHGNEYAGALGIERVIAALAANPARVQRGTVTLLPVANPEGFATKTRYLNINPNRIFKRHGQPRIYEELLVTRLCDFVDACDYLLDIHTYVAPPSIPFVFADQPEDIDFATALQTSFVLTGWADLVGSATDSTSYAHQQGKPAVTLECGQQDDPVSIDVAEAAIWRALLHLQLIKALPPHILAGGLSQQLRLHTRVVKAREGQLTPGLQHLQAVSAGEVLACYADGEAIAASVDAILIMPKHDARLGDEWFYLANNVNK